MTGNWVASWACAPQWAADEGLPFSGAVLRQTVRTTLAGLRMGVRLSNAYGDAPLVVRAAAVALPADGRAGVAAVQPGTSRLLTFDGRGSVVIAPGAEAVSDRVEFAVPARANLAVTLHLGAVTGLTSHPGSRTTSYLLPADSLPAGLSTEDMVMAAELGPAVPVEHWYFLTRLEVAAPTGTRAAVLIGDSLTDGRGSTTDGNDRWPDLLADRLVGPDDRRLALLNQGIGGNRVLREGLGPGIESRLHRDALDIPDVAWVVLFAGVNDIGTADATEAGQQQVLGELIEAHGRMDGQARLLGIALYAATVTPFGGHDYDDPDGRREQTRQRLNIWLRNAYPGRLLDFDVAVRDPDRPTHLSAAYDSGDGLHLNPAGYQALAAAVPLDLFR